MGYYLPLDVYLHAMERLTYPFPYTELPFNAGVFFFSLLATLGERVLTAPLRQLENTLDIWGSFLSPWSIIMPSFGKPTPSR